MLRHRPPVEPGIKVLEIGAFFGVVCIALASLGYDVTAADVPEYIDLPEQKERYGRFGIATRGVRLQAFAMPFEDERFDVIIMSEVLEHLNFNPLPLLKEINRIGAPGSIFYVSMPNAASIFRRLGARPRIRAGASRSPSSSSQLDPKNLLIGNGHWREYTAAETRWMLEPLGYRIADQYYCSFAEIPPFNGLRSRLFRTFLKRWPVFKENRTTIAIRDRRPALEFDIPQTVHPTLRSILAAGQ